MTGLGSDWTDGPAIAQSVRGLAIQAEALRMAADWCELGHILGVGTIAVGPTGAISVHVEPAGKLPPAAVRLRSLWSVWDAAELEIGTPIRLAAGTWGQLVRLRVPVPGLDLTLWCYERITNPHLAAA